jgi:hypothetical protein
MTKIVSEDAMATRQLAEAMQKTGMLASED